jgi:catechol 2,3-dioxygenase-like lactoylglutathione lyase family enzyme
MTIKHPSSAFPGSAGPLYSKSQLTASGVTLQIDSTVLANGAKACYNSVTLSTAKENRSMTHPPFSSQITFLYTHDLEATARFYEEALVLPLKLDQGSCRIYQVSQEGYLGFCQRDDAPQQPSAPTMDQVIMTLVTSDVDGWYHRLSNRGVAFEKPPSVNPKYSIYHCFLRDPNGYLIEIQRFLHPF